MAKPIYVKFEFCVLTVEHLITYNDLVPTVQFPPSCSIFFAGNFFLDADSTLCDVLRL